MRVYEGETPRNVGINIGQPDGVIIKEEIVRRDADGSQTLMVPANVKVSPAYLDALGITDYEQPDNMNTAGEEAERFKREATTPREVHEYQQRIAQLEQEVLNLKQGGTATNGDNQEDPNAHGEEGNSQEDGNQESSTQAHTGRSASTSRRDATKNRR